MHPGTSSTREVEAGGSDVQGYTHLHSSQDLPGIYETLGGRDGGGNEGLEAGLTARTDICERIHMLAQGTQVGGEAGTSVPEFLWRLSSAGWSLLVYSSPVPAAESQCQSKRSEVLL